MFFEVSYMYCLLFRIGFGIKGSRLNYEEFLRVFEDGRKEYYQRFLLEVRIEECGVFSFQEAEIKFRRVIENQGDVFGKVCGQECCSFCDDINIVNLQEICSCDDVINYYKVLVGFYLNYMLKDFVNINFIEI